MKTTKSKEFFMRFAFNLALCFMLMSASVFAQDNYKNTTATQESPIGTLEYKGGFPTKATVKKAFDQLDRQRATQAANSFSM